MLSRLVVLSGAISSGKTVLATNLEREYDAVVVKTRDLIVQARPRTPKERVAFQRTGEALDKATKGKWVVDGLRAVQPTWFAGALPKLVVVDSIRVTEQVEYLREAFGNRVFHIHLTAEIAELDRRFSARHSALTEASSYSQARQSRTERNIERLREKADIVIATDRNTDRDVLARAAIQLGLNTRTSHPLVDVIVGGQYGSEGKGNIVAYLASEYTVLIRVGSVNAGHKVFLNPPYTFKQLPSGTLHNDRAHIVLGPGTQICLDVLKKEVADCRLSYERLSIDPQAMIIEDLDVPAERVLRERIGSTGQGVGSAASRRILRREDVRLARDIKDLRPYLRPTAEVLDRAYMQGEKIMLEGTQGTSLSLFHGEYPFVTSRDTTVSGCMAEAGIPPKMIRRVVMVCRTYPIRVESPTGGTSGPMSQEISFATIAARSGILEKDLEDAEKTSTTSRKRRVAEFDWGQLRRSSMLNGPTDIALTFVDYLGIANRRARRFEQLTAETINFVEEVERVSCAPVSLISTRFHWRSVIDRRNW